MTNKFKFGDKVWHDKTNLAVVHSLDDELNGIYKIVYQDSPEWIYLARHAAPAGAAKRGSTGRPFWAGKRDGRAAARDPA